jgi:hypothetical protein
MKIALFYHCLFYRDGHVCQAAPIIVAEQMRELSSSGLLAAADEIHIGVNGGDESAVDAHALLPRRTNIIFHGQQCHTELRTLQMIERWVPDHPDGWGVLYFHSKGVTHAVNEDHSNRWRRCMMKNAVTNWRACVSDLDSGYDAVGSHWMEPPQTPPGQYIFAGTVFWATSKFLSTLPPLAERAQIKLTGLDAPESRYEAEVWIGNGPRVPHVKDYHKNWNPSLIAGCSP